jgi:hypothetical protein
MIMRTAALWVLFFAICAGLGYPTLNRYNPATTSGTKDASRYAAMVQGVHPQGVKGIRPHYQYRLLVPWMARPVHHMAAGRLGSWDPVFFALLVVNASFTASAACLIVLLARHFTGDVGVGLLGALLYLANFTVPNLYLAGLTDAAEGFFLVLAAWCLARGQWWPLPLIGLTAPWGKETFVVLGTVMALTWWSVEAVRERCLRPGRIVSAIGMGLAGLGAAAAARRYIDGYWSSPLDIAQSFHRGNRFWLSLLGMLTASTLWYSFIWLVPLGVWRLARLPAPWVLSSFVTAGITLLLAAYHGAGGNVSRPLFSVLGPLLSLSAGLWLTDWLAPSSRSSSPE